LAAAAATTTAKEAAAATTTAIVLARTAIAAIAARRPGPVLTIRGTAGPASAAQANAGVAARLASGTRT
jgi:hypothetical protein